MPKNDRAWVMEPPYSCPEARRYDVAGGATVEEFEHDDDAVLASEWPELTAFAGLVAAGRKP